MEKYCTLIYSGNDERVDFYEENGQFYMLAEDIGKCFGLSNPRIEVQNFFKSKKDLDSDTYSILAPIKGKKGKNVRCFTRQGVWRLGNYKGDREFCEWVNSIFNGLESGLVRTEPLEGETYNSQEALQRQQAKTPVTSGQEMSNYQRAHILIELAKLLKPNSVRSMAYQKAAFDLLLNRNFDDVYSDYLQEYDDQDNE